MTKLTYIVFLASFTYLLLALPTREYVSSNSYDASELDAVSLGPPNYQLYEYMKQYSELYEIPFSFALRCAAEETGYRGKLDFTYKPFIDKNRVSFADAHGPLQIQVPTANDMWDDRIITEEDLGYDIRLNVITSFRYQKYLYEIYNDWLKVYSVYNMGWQGKNKVNQYAKNIVLGPTSRI